MPTGSLCYSLGLSDFELTSEGIKRYFLLSTINYKDQPGLIHHFFSGLLIFLMSYSNLFLLPPPMILWSLLYWKDDTKLSCSHSVCLIFLPPSFRRPVVYSLLFGTMTSRLLIQWWVSSGSVISHRPHPPLPTATYQSPGTPTFVFPATTTINFLLHFSSCFPLYSY